MIPDLTPNPLAAATEIARAWQTARDQVAAAGIDIRRTPLFLTLGQPAGGSEEFFAACPITSPQPLVSASPDAPLQIYGDQQGLFVCCNQTSMLGDFVHRWRTAQPAPEVRGSSPTDPFSAATAGSLTTTGSLPGDVSAADSWSSLPPSEPHSSPSHESHFSSTGGDSAATAATLALARVADSRMASSPVMGVQSARSLATVRSIEHQLNELERQLALADEVLRPEPAVAASSLSATTTASENFASLCRLISEEREPYCPLNGVVVLLPIELTDCPQSAEQGSECIQRDLQTVMRTMETEVSVQFVVCGLGSCIGGSELLERLSQEQLYGTFGVTLPRTSGSDPELQERLIERASEWLCEGLLPALVRRVLQRDSEDELSDIAHPAGNRRLHALAVSLRGRRQNLSRLLRGSLSATPGRWHLRGCFFAPTASHVADHSLFAAGIMAQIHGIQHEVRWLESRRRRDAWFLAAACGGYTLIAAATLLTAAALLL